LALGSKLPGATETEEEMRPICTRESLNPVGLNESRMHHAKPERRERKKQRVDEQDLKPNPKEKQGLVVEEEQVLVCGKHLLKVRVTSRRAAD